MRLLLDTHVWLWAALEPERLSSEVARFLEDPESELWLSPISVWEALLLWERGRLVIDGDATRWIDDRLARAPLRDAALTRAVAVASRSVDVPHDDPADRFLAATAVVYDLTFATADANLLAGSGFDVIAAR